MSAPLLEVRDLHVWFDLPQGRVHALRGLDVTVGAGEGLGLVGESGCGKTTAILAMMGLLPPSATVAGQVLLNGENILARGEASVRRHRWTDLAMVFQGAMNAFSPVATVGAQIAEPMRLHRVAEGKQATARVRELLELVGIHPDKASRYPHEFSGGMRQRAAIAMALACEPKVLLADEPTTALDVIVQAQVLDLLDRLRTELGLVEVNGRPLSKLPLLPTAVDWLTMTRHSRTRSARAMTRSGRRLWMAQLCPRPQASVISMTVSTASGKLR
ncbi:ABC transporter ATP-binding protein [Nonomuraea sp. NPDC055795]